jgi:hypothetical protein
MLLEIIVIIKRVFFHLACILVIFFHLITYRLAFFIAFFIAIFFHLIVAAFRKLTLDDTPEKLAHVPCFRPGFVDGPLRALVFGWVHLLE